MSNNPTREQQLRYARELHAMFRNPSDDRRSDGRRGARRDTQVHVQGTRMYPCPQNRAPAPTPNRPARPPVQQTGLVMPAPDPRKFRLPLAALEITAKPKTSRDRSSHPC